MIIFRSEAERCYLTFESGFALWGRERNFVNDLEFEVALISCVSEIFQCIFIHIIRKIFSGSFKFFKLPNFLRFFKFHRFYVSQAFYIFCIFQAFYIFYSFQAFYIFCVSQAVYIFPSFRYFPNILYFSSLPNFSNFLNSFRKPDFLLRHERSFKTFI